MPYNKLPYIVNKKDQCKCIECFAIFEDKHLFNVGVSGKRKFQCALDMHLIGSLEDAKVKSCPRGKPAL